MLMLRHFRKFHPKSTQSRCHSRIKLDSTVNDALERGLYKPKIHPGVQKPRCIELPEHICDAIRKSVKDFPIKQLINDGAALNRYITSRQLPIEEDEVFRKRKRIQREILEKMGYNKIEEIETEDPSKLKQQLKAQVNQIFHRETYGWKPMIYNDYSALTYVIGRSALEYSTVQRVFNEIATRHPDFKPRSFFDFGAGVGTGTWAASHLWKKSIYEYFSVDTSREMNNLSDLILRDGDANKHLSLKNIYYRQFLPASSDTKYDLMLSAYAFMELPNVKVRIETLLTLWNKCDGYLVLIEQGTNAGFNLINEARDFFRNHLKETDDGFVYGPCSHQKACPRFMDPKDETPCNFPSAYQPLNIGESSSVSETRYSYLIVKRGQRSSEDKSIDWPRIVRPVLIRSKHTICRSCTQHGKLEEHIVTAKKHSKMTHQCARKTQWGDRLPVVVENDPEHGADDDSAVGSDTETENPEDATVRHETGHPKDATVRHN